MKRLLVACLIPILTFGGDAPEINLLHSPGFLRSSLVIESEREVFPSIIELINAILNKDSDKLLSIMIDNEPVHIGWGIRMTQEEIKAHFLEWVNNPDNESLHEIPLAYRLWDSPRINDDREKRGLSADFSSVHDILSTSSQIYVQLFSCSEWVYPWEIDCITVVITTSSDESSPRVAKRLKDASHDPVFKKINGEWKLVELFWGEP